MFEHAQNLYVNNKKCYTIHVTCQQMSAMILVNYIIGSRVGDPHGRTITTYKSFDNSRIIVALNSIFILSALDLNVINNANTLVP